MSFDTETARAIVRANPRFRFRYQFRHFETIQTPRAAHRGTSGRALTVDYIRRNLRQRRTVPGYIRNELATR